MGINILNIIMKEYVLFANIRDNMKKLSKNAKNNKNRYIMEYTIKNTKQFSARFKLDEYEYIDKKIKKSGMNKAEFIRWAIKELEENEKK